MLTIMLLTLAQAASMSPRMVVVPPDFPRLREPNRAGVTPFTNVPFSPPHWNRRPSPDIAIRGFRIDGDTLYVLVANQGKGRADGEIVLAAQAKWDGVKTDPAKARLGRMLAGEARWVPLQHFSVQVASASGSMPLFALDKATEVSAVARFIPASAPFLDRSGQGRDSTPDSNESNNALSVDGASIARGKPQ